MFTTIIFCIAGMTVVPENLTQTIRGRVVEKNTQEPIPGAHVVISGNYALTALAGMAHTQWITPTLTRNATPIISG